MLLQTKIPLTKQSDNLIDYHANMVMLGSCFVENIGKKLSYFKFSNTINPFGVLFHPQAIETIILKALTKQPYTKNDVFLHNEQWHCFDAHSKLSNTSKHALLECLNTNLTTIGTGINQASHVVITLGTAWVYKLKTTGKSVGNCHKLPQQEFDKTLLPVSEIVQSLQAIINQIKAVNSKAVVILTVSPIRHIKDGFVANTQSKSHLIAAIHHVIDKATNTFYFPAYEIMMDELRDYRFYAEDMIHPNATAINYIWNAFKTVWLSPKAFNTMKTVETIQKGLAHKPFNPESDLHLKFITHLNQQKAELKKQFPYIIF